MGFGLADMVPPGRGPAVPPKLHRVTHLISGECVLMGTSPRDELVAKAQKDRTWPLLRVEDLEMDHPAYAHVFGVSNPDVHPKSREIYNRMVDDARRIARKEP